MKKALSIILKNMMVIIRFGLYLKFFLLGAF